jgi:hypothetical protein
VLAEAPDVLISTSAEEPAASGTHRKDQLELASRDLGTTAPPLLQRWVGFELWGRLAAVAPLGTNL